MSGLGDKRAPPHMLYVGTRPVCVQLKNDVGSNQGRSRRSPGL